MVVEEGDLELAGRFIDVRNDADELAVEGGVVEATQPDEVVNAEGHVGLHDQRKMRRGRPGLATFERRAVNPIRQTVVEGLGQALLAGLAVKSYVLL